MFTDSISFYIALGIVGLIFLVLFGILAVYIFAGIVLAIWRLGGSVLARRRAREIDWEEFWEESARLDADAVLDKSDAQKKALDSRRFPSAITAQFFCDLLDLGQSETHFGEGGGFCSIVQ